MKSINFPTEKKKFEPESQENVKNCVKNHENCVFETKSCKKMIESAMNRYCIYRFFQLFNDKPMNGIINQTK